MDEADDAQDDALTVPTPSALVRARRLTDQRLAADPDNPLFAYASRELDVIEAGVGPTGKVSRDVYQTQRLGLMCARELEACDRPYCDAVYAMLEAIKP